jgi:NADH dehydrogenase
VLLLTGATGVLGSAVLRALVAARIPVRCLVRDPRRLGDHRVRVQLAIGDLADPSSWRHALRGVRTVVHLAGSDRDQPHASIEELNGLAAVRLRNAAARVGAERFLWAAPLGATRHARSRVLRAKALAAAAMEDAIVPTTTLAASFVYAPGDRRLTRLERFAWLPVLPWPGRGLAPVQPLWAEDLAACVMRLLELPPPDGHDRVELAGPQTMRQRDMAELVLRAARRRRRLAPVPLAVVEPLLRAHETLAGPTAVLTWEEALLRTEPSATPAGPAGAEALGVRPHAPAVVLGAR